MPFSPSQWAKKQASASFQSRTSLPTVQRTKYHGFQDARGGGHFSGRVTAALVAGGAVVLSAQTSRADTFKVKLIEALNSEVLKLSYGDDRVTGTVETGLTVKAGPGDTEESTYVVDMILKGGALKRIVIPDAALTALGDIVYKDGEPVGYEVTLTAYPDESGMTH